ncbi:hypothetical protein [Glycomyces sp. NPDC048151]|uniref:hypothetical protein n=1 Tax=Glycomyces sp. NPDC048151 TaxID=3364002 RepID=UPI00371DE18E
MAVRPDPPEPRPRRYPDVPMQARTRRRIAIAVSLILVLAAGIYAVRWIYTDRQAAEPVEAVRAFLEASRTGDIEAALDWTTAEPEGATDFLVPEAISSDWEIQDLGLHSWSPFAATATVWAAVEGPNGTQLTAWFDLEEHPGGWRLADPFATLSIDTLPVPYLDVNGVTVPLELDPYEGRDFALLPGVYQLYPDPPAPFAYDAEPLLALGERLVSEDGTDYPHLPAAFEGFTAAEDSETELNERLAAYLDECMANPDGPEGFGCPFGLRQYDIDVEGFNLGDVRWEIVEYPQAAVGSYGYGIYSPFDVILLTRHEGLARVTAVDASSGAEAVLECPLTASGLYLAPDAAGDYLIGPNQDPNAPSPDDTLWRDGYDSWCETV